MAMNLEKLFQKIFESEQTEDNRREQIASLKKRIHQSEIELQSLKDSCASSKGRLHILIRQYHGERAEWSVLVAQKKSMEYQKVKYESDIEKLKKECAKKKERVVQMQSDYTKKVRQFCACYDLTGEGAQKRRQAKVDEIKRLDLEIQKELKKVENLQLNEEKLADVLGQKKCLQAEVSQLQSQIIEADSVLERMKLEAKAEAEKTEKFRLSMLVDPELLQLQKEFECVNSQNHELEQIARNARTELERVKKSTSSKKKQNRQSGRISKSFKFHFFG